MQKINKFISMIGLCQKAGKLVSGELPCENAIKGKKVKLIILAEDVSKNTEKKFANSGKFYGCEILKTGTKEELGKAIGKDMRSVIAVTDDGFAAQLKKLLDEK